MIVGHGWQSKVECFPTDVSDAITSVMCQQANMKNIFISGPGRGGGGGRGGLLRIFGGSRWLHSTLFLTKICNFLVHYLRRGLSKQFKPIFRPGQ